MSMLFESIQVLGSQMNTGFETEGARRREDYKNLDKMDAAAK